LRDKVDIRQLNKLAMLNTKNNFLYMWCGAHRMIKEKILGKN